jgi:hypothetical protein
MKKFNLISYFNGRVIRTIEAASELEAVQFCNKKDIDCENDYYLQEQTSFIKDLNNSIDMCEHNERFNLNKLGIQL